MVVNRLAHFSPGRVIILSLVGIIIVGAALLALPASRLVSIDLLDLIFTATSALCVTGLWTVPLNSFTPLGHGIILVLMQIGGLGLITLTIFLLSLVTELGFTMQLMVGRLLDLETWRGIKRLLVVTVSVTVLAEVIGTCCFLPTFLQKYGCKKALFLSFFHAVSCFCNAGITIHNDGLINYQHNYFFLSITALLILIGGFGFVSWNELVLYAQSFARKKRHFVSLHSKISIYGSLIFLLFSTMIIFATEYHHAFAGIGPLRSLFYSLFHAISWRSTGFMCLPLQTFQGATLFLALGISFIGSSPSSTGSGVKNTTFIIVLHALKSTIFGKNSIDLYGRHIPDEQVHKAVTIVVLSYFWIIIVTFVLLLVEKNGTFFELCSEATTAFTNLGLSQGITPLLSDAGKILIGISIIAGRIGSLALILAVLDMTHQRRPEKVEFSYPEERIMLG